MRASTSNSDYVGTAAADLSINLDKTMGDSYNMDVIGRYFHIDDSSYRVLGLAINMVGGTSIRLLCIDKEQSTVEKPYYVSMRILEPYPKGILQSLFEDLEVVLFSEHDKHLENIDFEHEIRFKPPIIG